MSARQGNMILAMGCAIGIPVALLVAKIDFALGILTLICVVSVAFLGMERE